MNELLCFFLLSPVSLCFFFDDRSAPSSDSFRDFFDLSDFDFLAEVKVGGASSISTSDASSSDKAIFWNLGARPASSESLSSSSDEYPIIPGALANPIGWYRALRPLGCSRTGLFAGTVAMLESDLERLTTCCR